jgi:hypothetical protein
MEDDVDLVLQPLSVGVDGEASRCDDGVARGCGGGAWLLPWGGVKVDGLHPCSFFVVWFFVDFFAAAEAVDLKDLAIVSLMVSLLSLLSTLVIVVVEFASSSLLLLVLSWLLSGG